MNLKSGSTFWTYTNSPPPPAPPLDRDLSCEVAIIGSGITGAFAAHYLTAAGFRAVLVDRRALAEGSTSASTGLLQYELDTRLLDLIEHVGRDAAFAIYRLSESALHKMQSLIRALGISCDLAVKESLYLAHADNEIDTFKSEAAARRACGIDVRFLAREELRERFAIKRPAGILSPFALELDPYRLTRELLAAAIRRGLQVFGETEIVEYTPAVDSVALRTGTGRIITARRVIFATGYETPEFLRLNVRLKSTYALTSQPQVAGAALLRRCLLWESARPYLYARTTSDGRVMIGGEDTDDIDPATRDALLSEKTRRLVDKFSQLFPASKIIPEIAWAGTFAETPDGLPFIGPSAQFPLGRFALGYGGNGITFSLIAGELIRDELLGRRHDAAAYFRLDRPMPS